jgi:hypothetical protein
MKYSAMPIKYSAMPMKYSAMPMRYSAMPTKKVPLSAGYSAMPMDYSAMPSKSGSKRERQDGIYSAMPTALPCGGMIYLIIST